MVIPHCSLASFLFVCFFVTRPTFGSANSVSGGFAEKCTMRQTGQLSAWRRSAVEKLVVKQVSRATVGRKDPPRL